MDGSISRISQFIIKQNLDPLNLPQTETKLWTVRNDLIDSIYKMKEKIKSQNLITLIINYVQSGSKYVS